DGLRDGETTDDAGDVGRSQRRLLRAERRASEWHLPSRRHPRDPSEPVTLDGLLDVRRVSFRGTWRGSGQRRALNFLNKTPGTNGMSLFTSDWGSTTPRVAGAFAV